MAQHSVQPARVLTLRVAAAVAGVSAAAGLAGCACTQAICFDDLVLDLDTDLDAPGIYRVEIEGNRKVSCTFRIHEDGEIDVPVGCEVIVGVGAAPQPGTAIAGIAPDVPVRAPISWISAQVGRASSLRTRVHVRIQHDDALLVDDRVSVRWRGEQPNGPGCGGDCTRGGTTVAIDDDPRTVDPIPADAFVGWDCLQAVGADEDGVIDLGRLSEDVGVHGITFEVENTCDEDEVSVSDFRILEAGSARVSADPVPTMPIRPGERATFGFEARDVDPETRFEVELVGTVQPVALAVSLVGEPSR